MRPGPTPAHALSRLRFKLWPNHPFDGAMSIRLVNGYACRNCADEELAKRGIDPAHPKTALSGSEVYVSPEQADKNRYGQKLPLETGPLGSTLNLLA